MYVVAAEEHCCVISCTRTAYTSSIIIKMVLTVAVTIKTGFSVTACGDGSLAIVDVVPNVSTILLVLSSPLFVLSISFICGYMCLPLFNNILLFLQLCFLIIFPLRFLCSYSSSFSSSFYLFLFALPPPPLLTGPPFVTYPLVL